MAEIHVQTKRKPTPAWIWVLLAVVVIAAIVFFVVRQKKANQENTTNKPTSFIQVPVCSRGYLT